MCLTVRRKGCDDNNIKEKTKVVLKKLSHSLNFGECF